MSIQPKPLMNINLWADLDGVAPKPSIPHQPITPNPTVTLTLFKGAQSRSCPHIAYEAPVYTTPSQQINMLDALNALSELQRARTKAPYYSFGAWTGSHQSQGHRHQTALCMEYDVKNAMRVAEILRHDAGVAFWIIPTHTYNTNCYMFALPLLTPIVDKKDPKRLASLIAQSMGQPGLTRDSYNPTYFFKMRSDNHSYFSDGRILDPVQAIANAKGTFTSLSKFER